MHFLSHLDHTIFKARGCMSTKDFKFYCSILRFSSHECPIQVFKWRIQYSKSRTYTEGKISCPFFDLMKQSTSQSFSKLIRQNFKTEFGLWLFYQTVLLLLLLLSRFSHVWLCATPETAAHQAPLSLGFFRQEYWSGLPFPSPMHESEKWRWSRSVVPDSSRPHGLQPTRLLRPWDSRGKSPGVGCHCLLNTVGSNVK